MWRIYILLFYSCAVFIIDCNGKYERALLMSAFFENPHSNDTKHIYASDGDPVELIGKITNNVPFDSHYVVLKNRLSQIFSVDSNYQRRQLYMYEIQSRSILVFMNFDWQTEFTNLSASVVHSGVSRSTGVNVAVDWVSNNVYWTDPTYRWIVLQGGQRGSEAIDKTKYKVIVRKDLIMPVGLAVDPVHGYIFWSDVGSVVKIERANLIGGERSTILSTGLAYPTAIDVDLTSSHIYWVDAIRDSLESSDFDGNNRRTVRRMSHTLFTDLVVLRDVVTVNDYQSGKAFILNATNGETIINNLGIQNGAKHWALGLYTSEVQPTMTDRCSSCNSDLCANQLGNPQCLCREGYQLNFDGVSCSETEGEFHKAIVMAGTSALCMQVIGVLNANIDKTNCFLNTSNIAHFDMDMTNRKIFYAIGSTVSYALIEDRLSASQLFSTTSEITGLSLNWLDGNIYVATGRNSAGTIQVFSQASMSVFTILDSNLFHPRELVILPLDGIMVWISGSGSDVKIETSAMDGTDRSTIVNSTYLTNPRKITVDTSINMLYWTDGAHIKRSMLDGSGIETISINNVFVPFLISIYQSHLIFTENVFDTSFIKADNLNSPKDLDRNIQSPIGPLVGLKVLDSFLQPSEKGPCDVMNGGCEHICLPIGKTKLCQCEYGFQLDRNKQTCSSTLIEDNFLLVTDWTHDRIYQVALDTGTVFGLDTDQISNPIGIAFNSKTKQVIWCDNAGLLHGIQLNGTGYKILADLEYLHIHSDRLAIDYSTGNIYYTAVPLTADGFSGIGVITHDGLHRKLIEDGSKPRDIVLDPEDGQLFWSDHETTSPFVKSASMDGSRINTILSSTLDIRWPNGLAIDTQLNYLYLSDGYLNTIRRCNYGGTCLVFHESENSHLMDIALLDGHLYFTAWNRQFITKLNIDDKSEITKVAEQSELGRLDSLAIYRSSQTTYSESASCKQNNGGCSTFCFPSPAGHVCGCEDGVELLNDDKTCETAISTSTISTTTSGTQFTSGKQSSSAITTSTISTTTSGTQFTSGKQSSSGAPFLKEEIKGIPIPVVAGSMAGGLLLIFLIVIIIIVAMKRNRNKHTPFENPAFDPYLEPIPIAGQATGGERPGTGGYDYIDDLHRTEDDVLKKKDKMKQTTNMSDDADSSIHVNRRFPGTDTLTRPRNVPSSMNDYQAYVPRETVNTYCEPVNAENPYLSPSVIASAPDDQYLNPANLSRRGDSASPIGNGMYGVQNHEAKAEDKLTPPPWRRQLGYPTYGARGPPPPLPVKRGRKFDEPDQDYIDPVSTIDGGHLES